MTGYAYKPVPIGVFGEGTVKRSYQLLSLLTACEHCAWYIGDGVVMLARTQPPKTCLKSLSSRKRLHVRFTTG
jgi:hypothetical protein